MDINLSLKQKLFCQAYVETLGNGAEAVTKAGYALSRKGGHPDRNLAKSIASENLTKPDILAYINTLLEKAGLNDQNVSAQHWFLVNQNADLSVKAKAIDMYYKLKGKYTLPDPNEGQYEEIEAIVMRVKRMFPDST